MKNIIKTLAIFLSVFLLWALLGMKKADKEIYLSSTTLDKSTPLNVNIDVEFIKGLNPAYER